MHCVGGVSMLKVVIRAITIRLERGQNTRQYMIYALHSFSLVPFMSRTVGNPTEVVTV